MSVACNSGPCSLKWSNTALVAANVSGWRDEGARKKGDADLRKGVVSELPRAAVKGVHELRFSGENSDRHSACHDLAIGCKVCPDAKQRLATALVDLKAGNDLVKDQRTSGLFCDPSDLLEKFHGLQIRMTALDRLDQDRSEIGRRFAESTPAISAVP